MHDRTGWTKGATGNVSIRRRDGTEKTYKNLVEFMRPCATCAENFSIFVTPKIAAGHADSNSFGLKNCEKHRRSSIRKAEPELEKLRMANAVMKEELSGLYGRLSEMFDETQRLKARLAKYELQPAMEAQAALTFPWSTQ